MTIRTITNLAFLACAAVSMSGCLSVGPDYAAPSVSMDPWSAAVATQVQGGRPELEKWWTGFNDPILDQLIDRTRESNRDLKISAQRINEARAQRGIARSQRFPAVGSGGDYARIRASESLLVPPPENPSNLFTAGFDAGWEVDVFGGIRRSVEAADASVDASIETYRDVLVTLFSETALNYVEFRTLQRRISLANENIETQAKTVELTRVRFETDLAPKIDLTQATTNYEISRSVVPLLETQLALAKNRLATLTGGYPGSLDKLLARKRGIPVPRPGYSAGLPADLLRARPDIRRAEREFAAQTAQIGVAAADLYPRFVLAGNFSLQSIDGSDFFDAASRAYSFGPAFSWQVFSAGRIRSSIKIEESRAEQALLNYENAVLLAVAEVESSMIAIANERRRNGHLNEAVKNATETVGMVLDGYRNDVFDFQRVLDAERTKFDTEDEAASSKGDIAKEYIRLYKALGGGTEIEVVAPEEPRTTTSGWLRRESNLQGADSPSGDEVPKVDR